MKKIAFSLAFIVAVFALQLASVEPVMAYMTYDYTGNAYDQGGSGSPGYTPSLGTNVTASVTFDSTVASGFTGTILSPHFQAWSITSGTDTITNANQNTLYNFYLFFTLQNGAIESWSLEGIDKAQTVFIGSQNAPLPGQDSIGVNMGGGGLYPAFLTVAWNHAPGTWTLEGSPSSVPIPSTMLLLGSGLGGLAAFRKKFRA